MDKLAMAELKRNKRRFKLYFTDTRTKEYYHPLAQIAAAQKELQK